MRHGESEANRCGLIVSTPEKGIAGFGLTEKGREMTKESVSRGKFTSPITRIISSDFRRAIETARIAADELETGEPELNFLLRERYFGILDEGDNSQYEKVWEEDRQNPDNSINNVESPREVARRIISLFEELEGRFEGEHILLVSHGDTLQIMQSIASGHPANLHRDIPHLHPAEIRPLGAIKSFPDIKEIL